MHETTAIRPIDLDAIRVAVEAIRRAEQDSATARRRLERMLDGIDERAARTADDEPTDDELITIEAEARARLIERAKPCPDCKGRSGAGIADLATGLCVECQDDRLRIERECKTIVGSPHRLNHPPNKIVDRYGERTSRPGGVYADFTIPPQPRRDPLAEACGVVAAIDPEVFREAASC
jgi:hypothetical protein